MTSTDYMTPADVAAATGITPENETERAALLACADFALSCDDDELGPVELCRCEYADWLGGVSPLCDVIFNYAEGQ